MADDVRGMTAAEMGRGIEAGRIDPRDLTEAHLAAIDAHPEGGRIYAATLPDRARAEAAAAATRAKAGVRRGPLDGVPISWKDLFDTAGVETTSGSALLAGRRPARDAALLAQAGQAGLVALGKTHQTELAFSGLGINPVTATPPNIHDPKRAPGGSSSGAAASVSHGLAAAGIGTDTGGSVRVPAAWQDLVGLKPSAGRLPMAGALPLCPNFDTAGPLCRSVEDAALLLAALSAEAWLPPAPIAPKGRRFLVASDPAIAPLDAAPQTAFEAALSALSAAGATLTREALPAIGDALALAPVLFATEAYASWEAEIEAAPEKMHPPVLDRFRSGKAWSGPAHAAAWNALRALRAALWAEAGRFDAILLPTSPILPPEVAPLLADDAAFAARNLEALRNTRVVNLWNGAALTVATETPSAGLMLITPPGSERFLLALGAGVARTLGRDQ